jgi:hypothetical protein
MMGAGLTAAAAGVAAILSNKKTRKQLETKAKKAVADIRRDPKMKEIGSDTADFLGRIGEAIKNFFK